MLSVTRKFFKNVPAATKTYHNIHQKNVHGYFQYSWDKKHSKKKRGQLFVKFCPWKNIPFWKFLPVKKKLIYARETLSSTREKISKSARENFWLPVKIFKRVPVKNNCYPWKKPKKTQKCVFTGTFDFHGEKKTLFHGDCFSGSKKWTKMEINWLVCQRGCCLIWRRKQCKSLYHGFRFKMVVKIIISQKCRFAARY